MTPHIPQEFSTRSDHRKSLVFNVNTIPPRYPGEDEEDEGEDEDEGEEEDRTDEPPVVREPDED